MPLILLAIVLVVTFYRLLIGDVLFWGLPSLQFYPWREYAFDALRHGQLPFWNPYNGAGTPLIANYQSAVFYPLHWPGIVLPLGWYMGVSVVLHLFIAGWGMWMFVGRLGIPSPGRGVSTLAFGLTSFLVARLGTFPMIDVVAWLPWLMWAVLGVLLYARQRDIGWVALFAALQLLAGHAQMTWYSFVMAGVYASWWIARYDREQWRRLGLIIIGLILGAGIAAIQLIPTAELLLQSQRSSGVDFDFAANFSYSLTRLPNLLTPNVFGNPGFGTYLTGGAFFEDAVYIGLLPLVSAVAALFGWLSAKLRRSDSERPAFFRDVPFWWLWAVVVFVIALGRNTPVYPFLFEHVPTFDAFQAPVRWHVLTVFSLSVLAGMGVSVWGRGHWVLFGTRLAIAGSIGAALLAQFGASRILTPEVLEDSGVQVLIDAIVTIGILAAILGGLTLSQPEETKGKRYRWWKLSVLIFLAIDLGWAARGLNPVVPAEFYERREIGSDSSEIVRAYWPRDLEEDEDGVKFGTYFQFRDYRVAVDAWRELRTSELPNLNLIDRQYLFNNFDPLLVGHFADYVDLVEAVDGAQREHLLQAAGVNAVYVSSGAVEMLETEATRAWFAQEVRFNSEGDSVGDYLLNADWNPTERINIFCKVDCVEDLIVEQPGVVLDIHDTFNATIITVDTEDDGYLIVADTYYPGWQALVDGVPTKIKQANGAFRAIAVPAGAQSVRFEYRPSWLLPAVLITVASLLVTIVLFRVKNLTTKSSEDL
ncbi:MAG: hypothetical protein CUN54_03205 [Phototrophicales bacterium]|nr:MAG: hypothetical protein CUN54_03205 [Phototrophicales bacterium]